MKIKHIWSILCKESVINTDDNNVSIHGVLEELSVSVAPKKGTKKLPEKFALPIQYEIVSLWSKDKRAESIRAEIEYAFMSPNGDELLKTSQKIEIPGQVRRHRTRMKITGMPITKEGDYSFNISIKENGEKEFKPVSKIPLEVKIKLENPFKNV